MTEIDFQRTAASFSVAGGGSRKAGFSEKESEVGTDRKAAAAGIIQRRGGQAGANHRGVVAFRPFPVGIGGRGAPFAAAFLVLASLFLFVVGTASAASATDRPLLFKFQTGQRTANKVATDTASGAIYVTEGNPGTLPTTLKRFHSDGTPFAFPATGTNELALPSGDARLAVDNSGGPTQGRLYVFEFGSVTRSILAFDSNGNQLWTMGAPASGAKDIAVDSDGFLWVICEEGPPPFRIKVDPTVDPPTVVSSYENGSGYFGDIDRSGNFYTVPGGSPALRQWVGETETWSTPLDDFNGDVSVDQSTFAGHVFASRTSDFLELDQAGATVDTYAEEIMGGAGGTFAIEANGIAYDSTLDRVYVFVGNRSTAATNAARPTVLVFGPQVTGTVPDLTQAPPTSVEVSSAHFSGTANPQATSSEWYFEWRKEGQNWTTAQSSPPQALPNDSTDHPVEFDANSLRGNTTYQVRLVAVDTGTKLRSYSAEQTFTTATATSAPVVTIDPAGSITPTGAKISGTIDPEGDTAGWVVSLSTDPACSSGFQAQDPQEVTPGTTTPQAVEYPLTKLLPSEHYCAQIEATNSQGATTSETVEFTTAAAPVAQLETTGVAPRLDTSVRLNAFVNPEGEDVAYNFEYSADGGANWTALPGEIEESEARSQIVISSELSGLKPGTSYSFRVHVENPAGDDISDEREFSTRSTAEVTLPSRGYELVNNPDKGTQNVSIPDTLTAPQPITANGDKAMWMTLGGAPGGPNGTRTTFLAERMPTGWQSRAIVPQASEQYGGGTKAYKARFFASDMSGFVFTATTSTVQGVSEDNGVTRIDDARHQELLHVFPFDSSPDGIGVSDDLQHVLMVDGHAASGQLVDIGFGTPDVVSIMPDGTESDCGLASNFGFGRGFQWRPGYQMMDAVDASIVYFQTRPNGKCGGEVPDGLYVRNRDTDETTLVDPGVEKPGISEDVYFIRSTHDGEHAYFITASSLDPSDQNEGNDIYRWDLSDEESICLTCVVSDAEVYVTSGQKKAMISNDFSRIYFLSKNQLVSGAGAPNKFQLYLLEDGEINLVARVGDTFGSENAALSDDGNALLFEADAGKNLTSDAFTSKCRGFAEAGLEETCSEVYLYEAEEESLECVSCARGHVTSATGGRTGFKISADGRTAAFDSLETLDRQHDINGRRDLYEWRNGAIQLVTDGVTLFGERSSGATSVQAVSQDGSSIFYTAAQPDLTGYERDGFSNLYSARIGGGFPRPVLPVHCSEEECQGPLGIPPVAPTSGSNLVSGNGNAASQGQSPKCGKGKVRRHGKCVRKKRKKQQSAHRRGHAGGIHNGGRGK